jgi:hypothetical protein
LTAAEPKDLLEAMEHFKPLAVDEKWITDLKDKNTY